MKKLLDDIFHLGRFFIGLLNYKKMVGQFISTFLLLAVAAYISLNVANTAKSTDSITKSILSLVTLIKQK